MTQSERIEDKLVVWKNTVSCSAASKRGGPRAGDSARVNVQERSCAVCRKAQPSSCLLKFTLQNEMLLFGRGGKGRGAHVCPTESCITGLQAGRLSRAFKKSVQLKEPMPEMVQRLTEQARQRIIETLGLARRAGVLEIGTDRVAEKLRECMHRNNAGVAVAASDLAKRSSKQLDNGWVFGTSQQLGTWIGTTKAGAVWVPASRFAKTLEFWLELEKAMRMASESFQNETENRED